MKKMNNKICCLTATYGRLSKLNEAVTCFIQQDYTNKELIILNNHPSPLRCDLPDIKIYNEPGYPTQGDCRNRLIELADGDFVRTWDDDDLYMPWTLSQGIENIGSSAAWKPQKSWFWAEGRNPELSENAFEASMIVRMDVAKKYRYKPNSAGDEHSCLSRGIDLEGGCQTKDMKSLSSYVYRWGFGMWHISGTLGSSTVEQRTKNWMEKNNDVQDGIIKIVNLEYAWEKFPFWDKNYKRFVVNDNKN